MNERPILFSGEMVQAILKGAKTQTRRVIKPQPSSGVRALPFYPGGFEDLHGYLLPCPYGKPGDRLWVRETWATLKQYDDLAPSKIPLYDRPPAHWYDTDHGAWRHSEHRGKWRPSIFMPRWASRITLEITGIRAERVQDISHMDALAEGVPDVDIGRLLIAGSYAVTNYALLWDHINEARGYSWEQNPWVWVVEFKRVQP